MQKGAGSSSIEASLLDDATLALAQPHHHTSEKARKPMDDKVLTYSQLTAKDRAIYMRLMNAPRWREQAEEERRSWYTIPGRALIGYLLYRLYITIRGRYFQYDEQRAERIQKFLQEMQVKYECDSIDRRAFPGADERWQ